MFPEPRLSAVHARYRAHKATTPRGRRVALPAWTGRRRGRGPFQVVLFRLALLARMALRADLTHPQLSQHLIDLAGEVTGQVGTRVLVRHRGHVDQQPGITPAQLHLRGIEQAEQEVPENLIDRKHAQPPRMFTGILCRPLASLPGAMRLSSAQPGPGPDGGEAPVAAWTWSPLPAIELGAVSPSGRGWEAARYRQYDAYLAHKSLGETVIRAVAFLNGISSAM